MFEGTVSPTGQIEVPAAVARELPPGEPIQILLTWGSVDDEEAWRAAGASHLANAYAPEDDIYEELMNDAPVR